jgi:RNA polymerase sigma-70 factor (ECF subfamily)
MAYEDRVSPSTETSIVMAEARSIDEIVRRAQHGDVDAFEFIYRRAAPAIYRLCRRMLGDERDARDRVQDTFVRAWERLASYRGQSSLETWLHRVAVNVVLEHLRARKRDASRLIADDAHDPDDASGARAADVAIDASLDLATALDRLPAGARAVFVLHVEGYSHEEIAQMTGIAAGTARAQLWRARRALAKVLEP